MGAANAAEALRVKLHTSMRYHCRREENDGTIGLPPKRLGRGLAVGVVSAIVVVGLAASAWLFAGAVVFVIAWATQPGPTRAAR